MKNGIFQSYYSRIAKEGIIKSLVCGLIVGAGAMFLTSLVIWFFFAKYFWLAFVVWGIATAIATPLFYYKRFRPTTKAIAKRVDELGLEERILTMTELEGDTSFIAMKQREDALNALNTVNSQLLKIIVSTALVVTACVTSVAGIGMTAVSALAEFNIIEKGENIIVDNTPKTYSVLYDVDGEGWIETEEFQIVSEGDDAAPVMAVAANGWAFIGWSDGLNNPYRQDKKITRDFGVFAMFVELEDGEGEVEGEGEGEGEPDEGQPPSEESGEGNFDNNSNNNNNSGSGSGGKNEENNQVIDGESFYGDLYGQEKNDAYDYMNNNKDLSDKDKQMISDYYNGISKDPSKGNGGE